MISKYRLSLVKVQSDLKWMKFMHVGLQEPMEEVHIPLETHSKVDEGMSLWAFLTVIY